MTEADFEREATKLLRDLGLPSDTLNFFESDSAKSTNWKSALKTPSPPRARRVSSTGTTSQYERRRRERAGPSSLKRPGRNSIPWKSPPSQDTSNTGGSVLKNRLSGSAGAPSSIPVGNVNKSQLPQNITEQPQATSTPTKRIVHRPAPKAPPSSYQSQPVIRRALTTPGRTTASPPGPAKSTGQNTTPNQGSGIPVFTRRQSPAAASASATATAANGSKSSQLHKPAAKTAASVNRPTAAAVKSPGPSTAESELHTYESIDGNIISNATKSSSSPPKSTVLKKSVSSLSVPKHQDLSRRSSAPEKRDTQPQPATAASGSQSIPGQSSSNTSNHKQLLQLLSMSTKTSTQKVKQTSKPENRGSVANGNGIVIPERTSVLSYSRIPVTSSKSLPPGSESKSHASSFNTAGVGSRIPQPGSRGTQAGKTRQHRQKQEESPQGEVKVGNAMYDTLTPSPSSASAKQEDSLSEENGKPQKADANVSGFYDRLTPKEIMMITQGGELPKEDRETSPKAERSTATAATTSEPTEHLYAKVKKRRRHSEGQTTPENRQSLTSPISDPGTDPSTNDLKKRKKHSADETIQPGSREGSKPPSRNSLRDPRSPDKFNGVRSLSSGSTTASVSSPDSLTDRQTPDSDERRSKISVNWPKQSLDRNMSAVASSTVQALQTLVEVMTPGPDSSPPNGDRKFKFDENGTSGTPWYLLDTEWNESSGSSHPLSPTSEKITSPTIPPLSKSMTTGETGFTSKTGTSGGPRAVSERRRSSEQVNGAARRTSDVSNPKAADPLGSSSKTSLSSQGSHSSRGSQGGHVSTKGQASRSSQAKQPSPPPVPRTLSSPDHDYAVLEEPEHDYAILDPEFNKDFFGTFYTHNNFVPGMTIWRKMAFKLGNKHNNVPSLIPRPYEGEERAWYTLFTHVPGPPEKCGVGYTYTNWRSSACANSVYQALSSPS